MIIRKLEIVSFGKFLNKTIEFSDEFNVVFGNNESGKSTIINFIYAMFYGFGDNRGKTLSLRERYTPWSGGVCEGKITIVSDEGKNICIYRKAGNAKKYDIVRVYDADSGEEYQTSPEEIIGINSDTFFKTLCIKQLSSAFEGNNDEITQRLSNISAGGDEAVSYEKAQKILDSVRREIQPQRGQGGELAYITNKLTEIEKECLKNSKVKAEIKSIDSILPDAEREVSRLKAKQESLNNKDYTTEIARYQGRIEEMQKHSSSKGNMLFSVVGFIILAVALFFAFTDVSATIMLLPSAAVFLAVGFIKKQRSRNNNIEKAESDLQKLHHEKELLDKEKKTVFDNLLNAEKNLESLKIRKQSLAMTLSENDVSAEELLEKKRLLETRLHTVTITTEALRRAHENLQKNFTPSINKKAAGYFSTICDGKYSRIFCDKEFGVMIEKDIPRESGFFSGGTVDQLYLSVRLALIDMLYGDTSCPVLLDQPFLQYDKIRKDKTIKLLENLPKSRQILLFTSDEELNSTNKTTEILT